jgi:hypothetical protein
MNNDFRNIEIKPENVIPSEEFVLRAKEPYSCHIGKPVELVGSSGVFIGIYRGLREEDLVLQPYLMVQRHYSPGVSYANEEKRVQRFVWTDRPGFVAFRFVNAMTPVDESYLSERTSESAPRITIPRPHGE